MSIWDWIYDDYHNAYQSQDQGRMDLLDRYRAASPLFQSDPDQALALLTEGRYAAEQMNAPWFVLFYDHWRLQVLIHHKRDYVASMDLAIRATVAARKPSFADFPQRLCLHEDLINTYAGTDPTGYADAIEKALDYMQSEVGPDAECRFCLQGLRADFYRDTGRLDEAQQIVSRHIAHCEAERNYHHLCEAYLSQCHLSFQRGDLDTLLEAAKEGETTARRENKRRVMAEHIAWQAFVSRRHGKNAEAKRLLRLATNVQSRMGSLPENGYYDAICAFYIADEDYEAALKMRGKQLEQLEGKGQIFLQFQARLERGRLLARMGLPFEEEREAARLVARQMLKPDSAMKQLNDLDAASTG